jgi:hypothetical protein
VIVRGTNSIEIYKGPALKRCKEIRDSAYDAFEHFGKLRDITTLVASNILGQSSERKR